MEMRAPRAVPGGSLALRVARAARRYGLRGAAGQAWRHARALPRRRLAARLDRAYDEETGVETAGVVRLESLTVRGARGLGHRYQASEPAAFRRTIGALPIRHEEFAFVDLGSGKGRALLLASEFPFRTVTGVEFAPALHEISVRNIAAFAAARRRSGPIEALCLDAGAYEPPAGPLVVYLYNPFLEPVMRRVVERLSASLEAAPRPVYVVLSRDTPFGPLLEEAGFERATLPDAVTDAVYVSP